MGLILTPEKTQTARANLDREPWKSALAGTQKRLAAAATTGPKPLSGPYVGAKAVHETLEPALQTDGGHARDAAILYAITGERSYGELAARFLLAWAQRNIPTTYQASGGVAWGGAYQSFGAFAFAYAWDLLRGVGRHGKPRPFFDSAQKVLVRSWLSTFAAALNTFNAAKRAEHCIARDQAMRGFYEWGDVTRSFLYYDRYVGGEDTVGVQAARLLIYHGIGASALALAILEPGDILSIPAMLKAACRPRNDGGEPQVNIFKGYLSGRGGTMDYMTYNARLCSIVMELAQSLSRQVDVAGVRRSWEYLTTLYPSSPNPDDQVNASACMPRFWLAKREFGLGTPNATHWREPQYLGPVALTHGC
jgi:hypothetical protein